MRDDIDSGSKVATSIIGRSDCENSDSSDRQAAKVYQLMSGGDPFSYDGM